MSSYLTPLEVCERLIGGTTVLAGICGLGPKGPIFWRRQSERREAGDILSIHARKLLSHARRHRLGLTAEHLLYGAPEAEVQAILAAREPGTQAEAATSAMVPDPSAGGDVPAEDPPALHHRERAA